MLRLSKKVEYGLVALQHLARRGAEVGHPVSTVREIADEHEISYDLLAKIMQDLKKDGMICSSKGVRGGYALILAPQQIPLTRVVAALESDTSITSCTSEASEPCSREATCTIKGPMHDLQNALSSVMNGVTVAQLL